MAQKFRVGQRVCRVCWRDGKPFMKVATVTKTTTQTYYVDGDKKQSHGWHATAAGAIKFEYRCLFFDWDCLVGYRGRAADWTIGDTVECVCKVRRLERQMEKRGLLRKGLQ